MLHTSIKDHLKRLDENTIILTPNRRLSATLHKAYQQFKMEDNQAVWKTPDILPFTSWLQRAWQDYTSQTFDTTPFLLNSSQEQFLWEKILMNAEESHVLLKVSETADLAKSAWDLLNQWQIDIHQPIFETTSDYQALKRWLLSFAHLLEKNNWITLADLPNHVLEKINQRDIVPPKKILLAGFTEISPQLQSILKRCEDNGSHIEIISLARESSSSHRTCYPESEDEIRMMACWAKSTLIKHPTTRIGCVIPTLDKMRDRVKQIFSDVFAEGNAYTVDLLTCPFNISAGRSLIEYPVINAAIQLLNLHKRHITSIALSSLLNSPFLGEAESERIQRAILESELRKANINQIDLDHLEESIVYQYCPQLVNRILAFRRFIHAFEGIQTYTKWMDAISLGLKEMGWPGERSLSSPEYQTIEAWLATLNEISSLDQINQPVNFQLALAALQKITAKKIFQPQTPEAPIQVLGLLEAASLPFDYLWVTGMDDLSWPPQPKPHPFIPKSLQRELKMPHATAERELFFCDTMTKQFKECAEYSIFSHADKQDELELQASSLIRDLPLLNQSELGMIESDTAIKRVHASKWLEKIIDNTATTILPNEKIRGGINVIKQQALCPFKAFAEWRLHARELETPLPGLRAKDRGNIVHYILEIIWNELKNQTALLNIKAEALDKLIDASIDKAIGAHASSRSAYPQYLALEKLRLKELTYEWLQIEKERPHFDILTQEKSESIAIGQLNLSIRIDRIDVLENGKKLIIDYKTGNSDISKWFSDRPEEPQLPLYALMDTANTIGITFAQVATGNSGFKGVSQHSTDIQGVKPIAAWQEQIAAWQTTLTQLSDHFYQGVATVDPKEPNQTCQWCALNPLCRINEEQANVHTA
ncbi:MAG: PD-(D/E)XK nuclease family protein [Gammaproteobacteria bacterium]